jgi:hypothetical protein
MSIQYILDSNYQYVKNSVLPPDQILNTIEATTSVVTPFLKTDILKSKTLGGNIEVQSDILSTEDITCATLNYTTLNPPVSGGNPSTWSTYPATQNVDMGNNIITNTQDVNCKRVFVSDSGSGGLINIETTDTTLAYGSTGITLIAPEGVAGSLTLNTATRTQPDYGILDLPSATILYGSGDICIGSDNNTRVIYGGPTYNKAITISNKGSVSFNTTIADSIVTPGDFGVPGQIVSSQGNNLPPLWIDAPIPGDVSLWSNFTAQSTVDLAGQSITNADVITCNTLVYNDLSPAIDYILAPRVYYVMTNGNNTTGNGSFQKPFLTLAKAVDMATATGFVYTIYLGGGTFIYTSFKGSMNIIGQGRTTTKIETVNTGTTTTGAIITISDVEIGTLDASTANTNGGSITFNNCWFNCSVIDRSPLIQGSSTGKYIYENCLIESSNSSLANSFINANNPYTSFNNCTINVNSAVSLIETTGRCVSCLITNSMLYNSQTTDSFAPFIYYVGTAFIVCNLSTFKTVVASSATPRVATYSIFRCPSSATGATIQLFNSIFDLYGYSASSTLGGLSGIGKAKVSTGNCLSIPTGPSSFSNSTVTNYLAV